MAKRVPRRRPAPEMHSAGGASSSGPEASSSGLSWIRGLLQKSVNEYMGLDAKRKTPKWTHVANCEPPTLIWHTPSVELWLGGIDHLWSPDNILLYTTADRVPEVGSIGVMARD